MPLLPSFRGLLVWDLAPLSEDRATVWGLLLPPYRFMYVQYGLSATPRPPVVDKALRAFFET